MFRDYCEHALTPAEDGDGFVLACPPDIEASVYMSSRTNGGVYERARSKLVARSSGTPAMRSV